MTECWKCGRHVDHTSGLVKVRSKEQNEEKSEIIDGKIDPVYETKDRWFCLDCLGENL